MPEAFRSLRWRQAALELEARLRSVTGQAPERLDRAAIMADYPKRQFVYGWRVSVSFTDGVTRRIDVLATAGFPDILVRTALVDHPPRMTWPHVESDGVLCLLPNLADWDPDAPSEVTMNLVARSVRLVEELLEGKIVERDFREEFLTYWAYGVHPAVPDAVSLLRLEGPSRAIKAWKGHGLEVVAESAETISTWVHNRVGDDCDVTAVDAAFIWLDPAPLPAQYPKTAADLYAMAETAGPEAAAALSQAAEAEPDCLIAVLGAEGRGGAGAVAVRIVNPKHLPAHPRATDEPLSKGFRPKRAPKRVLESRFFGPSPAAPANVQRADSAWVHGRGRDPRTEQLKQSTVVIFGCGSVGAPLACTLAQAGVGRIVVVDHDKLSWANVGRHPLGATSVGRNKAEALAERLQADFPHLTIEGKNANLLEVLHTEGALLEQADLIIAATGNWSAEHALNQWHLRNGRQHPVVYGWTEAHACAGHAVTIGPAGGCLQCHMGRTGTPEFQVVTWPDDAGALQEEPACGAHYQPYGPVELAHVNAMICDVALGCLLEPPLVSTLRVYATSAGRVAALGGTFSAAWLDLGGDTSQPRTADRDWPSNCSSCGEFEVARSA